MKKALFLMAMLGFSTAAVAQQNDRDDMWEFGVFLNDQSSFTNTNGNGSGLDVDGSTGFGFGLNYNFNNHFALGGDMFWNSPDYEAVIVPLDGSGPQVIRHEMSLFTVSFKATLNLLDGPITPFVEAGLGWTDVDSNVVDQPPVTGCWWDPWWGYICDSFYSTYGKTQENYSASVGIRWDMDNGMTLKGLYGVMEIDSSSATKDVSLDIIRLDLAWRF